MALIRTFVLGLSFLLVWSGACIAQTTELSDDAFRSFVAELGKEAISMGIAEETVQKALPTVAFVDRAVTLDGKQPEHHITFSQYSKGSLAAYKIKKGRELLRKNKKRLLFFQKKYGVPASLIVALWGAESSYGGYSGHFSTLNSLATLAYEGRRASFFRDEFLAALKVLEQENIEPSDLQGSWAGAMGQCQFMPSTFLHYAADGDGDGKRNIWTNEADVFASIANFLQKLGWKSGKTWGREVRLTRAIPASMVGLNFEQDLAFWSSRGVKTIWRSHLPSIRLKASLIQPDGPGGRSFLVYDNFRSLMRWNRSTYFATSIGLLSDKIQSSK